MTIQKNLTTINRTVHDSRDIKYIVVHYTGNKGDTAYNNTVYFKNQYRGSSAHYFVDEKEIWQCVEDKNTAWHCGTKGKYYHNDCRNANSIGVEMCNSVTRNEDVENKTAELVKMLMDKYNIPIDNVIRHYDVTHKECPVTMIDNNAWTSFKIKIKGDAGMTETEKAKIQAIDDSLTNLYSIVERMKADYEKLHTMIKNIQPKVYNSVEILPDWARPTIQSMIDEGKIKGTGDALGLSEDVVKTLVIMNR